MHGEGFEMMIGPPTVIMKEINGFKHKPYKQLGVDVLEEYAGAVVDIFSRRKRKRSIILVQTLKVYPKVRIQFAQVVFFV